MNQYDIHMKQPIAAIYDSCLKILGTIGFTDVKIFGRDGHSMLCNSPSETNNTLLAFILDIYLSPPQLSII